MLTIATHYTAAQLAPLSACWREYERLHPGLRIVHRQSAIEDTLQSVLTARIGGTSPDIYSVYSLWAAQLVDGGVLDAPPADVSRLVADAFLPSTAEAIRVGGRLWGIPTEVSAVLLIYNKALFRKAGIAAPPRDWDELAADAARLTERDARGRITTAGFAFGPTAANATDPFLALLASRGVALLAPAPGVSGADGAGGEGDGRDNTGHGGPRLGGPRLGGPRLGDTGFGGTNLRAPQAVAVLAGEAGLFARGVASATLQVRDFPSGAVGMMIYANWYKDTLREAFGDAMEETVGVAPIPGGPEWRTLQYGFFWGVDSGSPHRRAAWDLLEWLSTPHAGGRSCTGDFLARLGALTGNRADLAASPEYDDAFSRPFVEAIRSGRAVAAPNVLHGAELQADLAAAIGRAWGGEAPAAALAEADREITALLRERD